MIPRGLGSRRGVYLSDYVLKEFSPCMSSERSWISSFYEDINLRGSVFMTSSLSSQRPHLRILLFWELELQWELGRRESRHIDSIANTNIAYKARNPLVML